MAKWALQPGGRWHSPRARRASEAAIAIALAALFLNAAATIEAGFTLQISYLATGAAVLIGAPFVLRGWQRLPPAARLSAAGLVVAYVFTALIGEARTLPGSSRSSYRTPLYIADLTLGLATIGLVAGLADTRERLRRLLMILSAGAAVGAVVGIYQWGALRLGLPLSDVNSAPNSDGFSRGHRYQGAGLLGWERARGTFKEPLYFGIFLATAIPVAGALLAERKEGRRRWMAALAVLAFGLLLTVSSLAWGVLAVCAVAGACAFAIASGRARLARLTGTVLALAVMIGPVVFVDPGLLSAATGRSAKDLRATSANRSGAWNRAIAVWEERPLVGAGPGQSSVRLAYRPDGTAVAPGLRAPLVLGSAQGLWAAALIDGGLLMLMAWTFLLGILLLGVTRAGLSRPDPLSIGALAAAGVAVIAAQFAGDRLDVRAWLVLGLAAASGTLGERSGETCEQAHEAAEQG